MINGILYSYIKDLNMKIILVNAQITKSKINTT